MGAEVFYSILGAFLALVIIGVGYLIFSCLRKKGHPDTDSKSVDDGRSREQTTGSYEEVDEEMGFKKHERVPSKAARMSRKDLDGIPLQIDPTQSNIVDANTAKMEEMKSKLRKMEQHSAGTGVDVNQFRRVKSETEGNLKAMTIGGVQMRQKSPSNREMKTFSVHSSTLPRNLDDADVREMFASRPLPPTPNEMIMIGFDDAPKNNILAAMKESRKQMANRNGMNNNNNSSNNGNKTATLPTKKSPSKAQFDPPRKTATLGGHSGRPSLIPPPDLPPPMLPPRNADTLKRNKSNEGTFATPGVKSPPPLRSKRSNTDLFMEAVSAIEDAEQNEGPRYTSLRASMSNSPRGSFGGNPRASIIEDEYLKGISRKEIIAFMNSNNESPYARLDRRASGDELEEGRRLSAIRREKFDVPDTSSEDSKRHSQDSFLDSVRQIEEVEYRSNLEDDDDGEDESHFESFTGKRDHDRYDYAENYHEVGDGDYEEEEEPEERPNTDIYSVPNKRRSQMYPE